MNKFSPKKPKKPDAAVRQQPESPGDLNIMPVFLGTIALFMLIALGATPGTTVGDVLYFGGPVSSVTAGTVNAAIVQDLWGEGAKPCSLNLQSMLRSGGMTRVEAVSREQVVLQWIAPKNAPSIGCPGAPALIAVSADDYQQLASWRQDRPQPGFR